MSEQQAEFFDKAEKILQSLESAKKWYKLASIAFTIAFLVFISASGVTVHRVNANEKNIKSAVSIKAFGLFQQNMENYSEALTNLVQKDYQEAAREFYKETQRINNNIFVYSTEINTRGGTAGNGGNE